MPHRRALIPVLLALVAAVLSGCAGLQPVPAADGPTRAGSGAAPQYPEASSQAGGTPPGEILFLSDGVEELDPAAASGLASCQRVRPAAGTAPAGRHREAPDFRAVSRLCGLPATP